MDRGTGEDLGKAVRTFAYDRSAVGRFLLGIFALPMVGLGLFAAVVLPLTAGRGQPLRGAASDAVEIGIWLSLGAFFGYWLWSVRQLSGHRTAVFVVHEHGLVYSLVADPVLGLPAASNREMIPWTAVAEVVEWRVGSRPARWLLPPSRRYRAAVATRDGWALTFTDATGGAPDLAAMVSAMAGVPISVAASRRLGQ